MYLRIFVYGLIAIAKGDQQATILLLNGYPHDPHDAYVAFDDNDKTCPDCGHYHLPIVDRSILGYSLQEGYDLVFGNVHAAGPKPHVSFAARESGSGLPNTPDEAAAFSWVTSIPAILGQGGNATKCRKDPKNCSRVPIAAKLQITAGTLQTCHLVQTLGKKCGTSPAVYPFNFDSPTLSSRRPRSRLAPAATTSSQLAPQAMASAVGVVIEIDDVKSLTLTLTKFGAKKATETITLYPTDCKEPQKGKCIDVFVGNIAKDDYNNPQGLKKAQHFPMFFKLLDDPSARSITPTIDEGACVTVQPVCRNDYPGVTSYMKKVRGKGWRQLESPLSRPICPMAMVAE